MFVAKNKIFEREMNTKKTKFTCSGVVINVTRKKMKTLRLTVKNGSAHVSSPWNMPQKIIEDFVVKNRPWIQEKIDKDNQKNQDFFDSLSHGGSIKVWGDDHLLNISNSLEKKDKWQKKEGELILCDVKNINFEGVMHCLDDFYRHELRQLIPVRLTYWENIMGVRVTHWTIRKMKTRWGSCHIQRQRISLNLDLARWPKGCLDYVIVHELVHLYETHHTPRFWQLVASFMPEWKHFHDMLNREVF